MINWGFDAKKYRIKYRCPLVKGKVKYCPYDRNCNKSLHGKAVYVRLASDLRLLTPVPRDSRLWKVVYKQRAASERVNNRFLNDYELEQNKRYGKAKLSFFAFSNLINIHLDAMVKFGHVSVFNFLAYFFCLTLLALFAMPFFICWFLLMVWSWFPWLL